jgi:hypothetical protein
MVIGGSSGGKVLLPSIVDDCGVCDRMQDEHGNKYIVDISSRKSFPGEERAD